MAAASLQGKGLVRAESASQTKNSKEEPESDFYLTRRSFKKSMRARSFGCIR
jgi:hypothetical protein